MASANVRTTRLRTLAHTIVLVAKHAHTRIQPENKNTTEENKVVGKIITKKKSLRTENV